MNTYAVQGSKCAPAPAFPLRFFLALFGSSGLGFDLQGAGEFAFASVLARQTKELFFCRAR